MSTLIRKDERTPTGHVLNGQVFWNSVSTVNVGDPVNDSIVRDSTDDIDIVWTGQIIADITVSGAGGLDTGTENSDTWYSVFVIADTNNVNDVDTLLSESITPTMPAGYDIYRRLGWVRNNGGDFMQFNQQGLNKEKSYYYEELFSKLQVLSQGGSVILTDVGLDSLMPPTSTFAFIRSEFSNMNGTQYDNFIIQAKNSPAGISVHGNKVGIILQDFVSHRLEFPTDENQTIEYRVSTIGNRLNLYVQGYRDSL